MRTAEGAARALALSLALTAVGTGTVVGTSPAAGALAGRSHPAASASPATAVPGGHPVGGRQLAAAGVIVNRLPGVPPPPAMPGASFLLADMDTGQILVAKAPHALHLPASTLKALTALTLIPLLSANRSIQVKPHDVRADGSRLGILPGTAYSVRTLMQGMLTTSGNDAAYALAGGYRSMAVTVRAMNATAARLGARDTVVKDPSGLDRAGQRSSAYDLALIGRAAMKLPDFRRYVLVKKASLPGGRTPDGTRTPGFKVNSHNRLLYNYPGAIGIKTGHTIAAKFTFIGAATRGGRTYLVTQMASPAERWRSTAALLDWAFTHADSLRPVGVLVPPRRATASGPSPKQPSPTGPSPTGPSPTGPSPTGPSSTRPPTTGSPSTVSPSTGPRASEQATAGKPPAQAASSSRGSASQPGRPPWVGLVALSGALLLTVGWAGRRISRKRR